MEWKTSIRRRVRSYGGQDNQHSTFNAQEKCEDGELRMAGGEDAMVKYYNTRNPRLYARTPRPSEKERKPSCL